MTSLTPPPTDRIATIESARRRVLGGDPTALAPSASVDAWIERSWQRCLGLGFRPDVKLGFDVVTAAGARRAHETNRQLVEAARPHLERLTRAIAPTRYFALLTNADGVVVDTAGPIDRSDRRVQVIARVGVDLSEAAVGTTAIGAALIEQQPVWLHRGEHFFADTSVYSCAGAPIVGPQGLCVGMIDVTGIEARERPQLRHLVRHVARAIENDLVSAAPAALRVRLGWPGRAGGSDDDGLISVDADGHIVGANPAAREMLGLPPWVSRSNTALDDVFAMPGASLFDAARAPDVPLEMPLWSGLRVQAWASATRASCAPPRAPSLGAAHPASNPAPHAPLRAVEADWIRQAVERARGNVASAARELGISRATVYRKLREARPSTASD